MIRFFCRKSVNEMKNKFFAGFGKKSHDMANNYFVEKPVKAIDSKLKFQFLNQKI